MVVVSEGVDITGEGTVQGAQLREGGREEGGSEK